MGYEPPWNVPAASNACRCGPVPQTRSAYALVGASVDGVYPPLGSVTPVLAGVGAARLIGFNPLVRP
jgi:hypothetical protein